MKKIYSIALLASISLSISAQQQTKALLNKSAAKISKTTASSFRPEKEIHSVWDTLSNVWVQKDSVIRSYSSTGNILTEKTYSITGGNLINRITNTYDANHKLISSMRESNFNGTLQNSSLETYTYNINGVITNNIYQYWNTSNNSWQNSSKRIYSYNNNQLLTFETQLWNPTTSSWDFSRLDNYTYNTSNQNTTILFQDWNTATNTYTNTSKQDNTFNGNGELITLIASEWDNGNWRMTDSLYNVTWHKWNTNIDDSEPLSAFIKNNYGIIEMFKLTFTYDVHGNATGDKEEKWNGISYILNYESITNYLYDANNSITQRIEKSSPGATQLARNRDKYDYSRLVATTASLKDLNKENYFDLYPNPTKENITINALQSSIINVINTLGEIVFTKQISEGKNVIDMSKQPLGIYYITDGKNSTKFIKN